MKAITFATFGGPEVLHLSDVPVPAPPAGTIRVRVKAVGVNPADWKIRRGWFESQFHTSLPSIPGSEIAGVVDAIGDGVAGVAVGDEVLGWAEGGAYAEFAIARTFTRKAPGVSWDVAAALPVAGEVAQRVLNLLNVQRGETLLVNGAAGSVGTIAVQLAVARGATVIGTASPDNLEYVRSLGALPVLYGDGLVERVRAVAPQGVNAVFDAAGKGALPAAITLAGGAARVITIADVDAAKYGVRFSAGTPADRSVSALAALVAQVAAGAVRVTIARTFPLARAAEAQRISEDGHVRGKLVLSI